jgi:hypothetical protein
VRSVAELLERVPGVSVSRTGGAGSQTGLFMRGTSTAQTLVLVDGQRIAAASSGTSSLEFLSPEQIERVEVVRGARSALYGSDAIGGVVQIFTRREEVLAARLPRHPFCYCKDPCVDRVAKPLEADAAKPRSRAKPRAARLCRRATADDR